MGRLNGAPVETVDVDVVPAPMVDNLTRLAEALNLLRPRWRVEGIPGDASNGSTWRSAPGWAAVSGAGSAGEDEAGADRTVEVGDVEARPPAVR